MMVILFCAPESCKQELKIPLESTYVSHLYGQLVNQYSPLAPIANNPDFEFTETG